MVCAPEQAGPLTSIAPCDTQSGFVICLWVRAAGVAVRSVLAAVLTKGVP